jgi:carboxyl-terminal processing protease
VLFALLLATTVDLAGDLGPLLKQFIAVYAAVEREAADPVRSEQAIYGGAIPGMLRRLDPHSVFFDPQQFDQLKELQRATRKGFGSVVSVLPGRVIVLQTLPGTPSARSGIAPGDEILAVNGYRLDRLEMDQLIELLSSSRQSEARLDVRRPGNVRLLQFVLTPEELQSPSVERAFLLSNGAGYIRIGSFDAETGKQLREAIEKLGGKELKGLVLDLRNNPGGLVEPALDAATLFLQPGKKILSVKGRRVDAREFDVPAGNQPYEFPVSVLVNGRSASAAEIVAAAIQDNARGVIVGEPSFGKGLVETVYPLSGNSGLALTTSYYYTPNGRSLQRPLSQGQIQTQAGSTGGIQPDRMVPPEMQTRLRAVLDASASFIGFATEYAQRHRTLAPDFTVSAELLDEFRTFLSNRNIRPGVSEWTAESGWIRSRLHQEIVNLVTGVAKGDEIEATRDPQIRAAVDALAERR